MFPFTEITLDFWLKKKILHDKTLDPFCRKCDTLKSFSTKNESYFFTWKLYHLCFTVQCYLQKQERLKFTENNKNLALFELYKPSKTWTRLHIFLTQLLSLESVFIRIYNGCEVYGVALQLSLGTHISHITIMFKLKGNNI